MESFFTNYVLVYVSEDKMVNWYGIFLILSLRNCIDIVQGIIHEELDANVNSVEIGWKRNQIRFYQIYFIILLYVVMFFFFLWAENKCSYRYGKWFHLVRLLGWGMGAALFFFSSVMFTSELTLPQFSPKEFYLFLPIYLIVTDFVAIIIWTLHLLNDYRLRQEEMREVPQSLPQDPEMQSPPEPERAEETKKLEEFVVETGFNQLYPTSFNQVSQSSKE